MKRSALPLVRGECSEHLVSVDGTPTIVCRGRITAETSSLFKKGVKSLAPQHKNVLADMSGVDYVDSFGLGAVLGAYISAKSAGCDLWHGRLSYCRPD
jgi:anti-anti-sigma factor